MESETTSWRVAVVQAASALMDSAACVDRAEALIARVGAEGARLALFPEAFISGYPRGMSFGAVVGSRTDAGRALWARYCRSAITVPGPETARLGVAARTAGLYLAIGVIERDPRTGGTLYCALLYFGPDGRLLGCHRKLKPTGSERLIWGEGDGSTLTVVDTPMGPAGGLICWENYMPLARAALYAKGVRLYLAPTADSRDGWQATLRHIALEGRCFVLGSNQYYTREMLPDDLQRLPELAEGPDVMCRGGSAIVSPMGEMLAGPLFDGEGVLYADLDPEAVTRARYDFDPVGHYARPDVFQLAVDERPRPGVTYRSKD